MSDDPWEPDLSNVKWYVPLTTIFRAIKIAWRKLFNRKGE